MTAGKSASKALSCTVPQDTFDALDEHRWSVRKNMSEMVTIALEEYLTNHKVKKNGGDDTPETVAAPDSAVAPVEAPAPAGKRR